MVKLDFAPVSHKMLHNFDGSLITCVQGFFESQACFANRMRPAEIYVLDDTCEPVIGRDLMISLNMQLDCGAKQVHHAKDDSQVVVPLEESSCPRAGQSPENYPPTGYGGPPVGTVPPPSQ